MEVVIAKSEIDCADFFELNLVVSLYLDVSEEPGQAAPFRATSQRFLPVMVKVVGPRNLFLTLGV